jgi:hypothetical protein
MHGIYTEFGTFRKEASHNWCTSRSIISRTTKILHVIDLNAVRQIWPPYAI